MESLISSTISVSNPLNPELVKSISPLRNLIRYFKYISEGVRVEQKQIKIIGKVEYIVLFECGCF